MRDLYVNGSPQPVGYMSHWRVHPRIRRSIVLANALSRAFALYRALDADRRAPFYLTSLIAGNRPAERLLTRGLPGFPTLHPFSDLTTFAIPLGRPRRAPELPAGLRLERGSEALLPGILDCLARNGARRQLAPVWTAETLCREEHTPGLAPEDFFVARNGERVVGCLAAWNQKSFKQTVVRGYSGALARFRKPLNLLARLAGRLPLPDPGTPLRSSFASHRAIDGDEKPVFAALLGAVARHAHERGDSFLLIGFAPADPLRAVASGSRRAALGSGAIPYRSRLYLAAWPEGEGEIARVDARIPGPEAALL